MESIEELNTDKKRKYISRTKESNSEEIGISDLVKELRKPSKNRARPVPLSKYVKEEDIDRTILDRTLGYKSFAKTNIPKDLIPKGVVVMWGRAKTGGVFDSLNQLDLEKHYWKLAGKEMIPELSSLNEFNTEEENEDLIFNGNNVLYWREEHIDKREQYAYQKKYKELNNFSGAFKTSFDKDGLRSSVISGEEESYRNAVPHAEKIMPGYSHQDMDNAQRLAFLDHMKSRPNNNFY